MLCSQLITVLIDCWVNFLNFFVSEINLNATAFLLSYSPASKSMMRTFASQYYGGGKDTRDFFDVFNHVMDGGKYSYLCICFSPLIPNKYRLSSFLSASEGPTVYYVKK